MTLNSGTVSSNNCHCIMCLVLFSWIIFSTVNVSVSLPHMTFFHQGHREVIMKGKEKKQHSTLEYSNPTLISFLKMTEEKDHIWWKSLYNGLEKKNKMTRAHAITPPSGARTKSPKETPHKHSICSRLLEMCSVFHLLYLWCISGRALR